MPAHEIWDKALGLIREQVGEGTYDLWFNPMRLDALESGVVSLEVPNRFFKEWVEDYHPTLIADALRKVDGQDYDVRFTVAAKQDEALLKEDEKRESRKNRLAKKGIYLNPKYTFENFVIGQSNQFAQAAAMAACEQPGKLYNPLFIYGGVGFGKTHLITAIGNATVDKRRNFNVLYVRTEQFINEVISAVRHGKTEELKKKYRTVDMILIDDVQFIENKNATQEELFHTMNELYEGGKQIVISSDRPPKDIKQITDRLRSRFSMGLIADIQAPEVETKITIIRKKAEADRLPLSPEVVTFIATRVKSNVRDLEACLVRLGAHMSLTGTTITTEMARSLLKDFISEDDRPLSVENIMKAVAEYYGIRVQDMKARKRNRDIALPRQIAMYIARTLTDVSLAEIGKQMGGKNHATVIYAMKQIKAKREADEQFDRMIETLVQRIQQ